jgi:hypothetical protein
MKSSSLLAVSAVFLFGCWPGPLVGDPIEPSSRAVDGGAGGALSFQQISADVFTQSCASSFCHQGNPPPTAPMSLDRDLAYAQLVGVASSQSPQLLRVKPGDPANSYLVIKLKSASTAQYGTTLMPLNRSSLTDEAIAAIEAWIARGAPND